MRKSKMFLAAAVAGLGLAAAADAAVIVTSLSLLKADGVTPVPDIAGVYQVQQGEVVKVQMDVEVQSPWLSRANRTAAQQPNKPLGLQTLNAQIFSSGAGLAAIGDGINAPQHWINDPNGDVVGLTGLYDFPFAVVAGSGVDGIGMVNVNFGLTSAATLSGKQIGALGAAEPLAIGDFKALGDGLFTLSSASNSAGVYKDGTTGTNLSSVAPDGFQYGSIQVQVNAIPEPTALGFIGLGGLALLRRRRD